MTQMNVSMTERLAGYVRKKVKGGHYNNASEVVREALRRMRDEEAKALRVAAPTTADILADLTAVEMEEIHRKVLAAMESVDGGDFVEYRGRDGVTRLMDEVKSRGRKRVRETA